MSKFKRATGYENKEAKELREKENYTEQLSKRPNKSSKDIDRLADLYLDLGKTYQNSAEKGGLINRIDNLRKAKQNYSQALKFGNTTQIKKAQELLTKINEGEIKSLFLRKGLEKKFVFATLSIIFLLSSLFFVSSGFTGYAILNLPENNSNWVGLCFFVCGLIFAFIYLKKNKDN